MPSDYDATEFIDGDLQGRPSPYSAVASQFPRAPSREEVDAKVSETQQKLAELKRAQEELERERATLEETRRRQMEFHTGRQEVIQNLTRGLGLLEEAEFNARRDAEQMAKALGDMRDAMGKVQAIHEETWTKDTFPVELTRGLTALENARMEWNAARLKFPVLSGVRADDAPIAAAPGAPVVSPLGAHSFGELCRFGFAMTWPLALVGLAGLGLLVALLLRR